MEVTRRRTHGTDPTDRGFTLIEMMIAVLVLMLVCGTVMKGVLDLTRLHTMVMNRTDMHSGVRNATELLTQEVGQAGRVAVPVPVTVTVATAPSATSLTVSSTTGMFIGERLVVDTGGNEETTSVVALNGNLITTPPMIHGHVVSARVAPLGGFSAGVVAPSMANGSTGSVLKIFGDINSDGNMVYVEYRCDTDNGRLYRNSMPFTAGAKPDVTVEQVLIDNILPNPDGSACFTYQVHTLNGVAFVTDVAITLTVRTNNRSVNTGQFETETKALLNVSPRNVFNMWQLAGLGVSLASNRVQPMPPTVQALLAD